MERNRMQGFTLMELMIVVVIIGILASVAYPAYQNSVIRSRRVEAQGALQQLSNLMERQFTAGSSYLVGGLAPPVIGAGGIFPNQTPIDGNVKAYALTIPVATATTFTLRATPINAQIGDGFLELTQTGLKSWDVDDSGGLGATENTWNP